MATATGSTGYALAAGGAVLYPQSKDMLLAPVSPHLSLSYPLVLPHTATVEMEAVSGYQAMLSIDGQIDMRLKKGDRARVKLSPHTARFLRTRPRDSFYSSLEGKLKVRQS